MRIAYAAVLLLLLTAGCTRVTPDAPVSEPQSAAPQPVTPQPVTPQPVTPPPAARPAAPATTKPAAAAAPAPTVKTPAPPAAPESGPLAPPVAKAPAAPALDLTALKEELRDTKAIGVFTKITLKNQVDDLLDRFRDYYRGKAKLTMGDLRQSFDLLMMKVLSLLQDGDQRLASAIVSSREAIWHLLADPTTFATLQG